MERVAQLVRARKFPLASVPDSVFVVVVVSIVAKDHGYFYWLKTAYQSCLPFKSACRAIGSPWSHVPDRFLFGWLVKYAVTSLEKKHTVCVCSAGLFVVVLLYCFTALLLGCW